MKDDQESESVTQRPGNLCKGELISVGVKMALGRTGKGDQPEIVLWLNFWAQDKGFGPFFACDLKDKILNP